MSIINFRENIVAEYLVDEAYKVADYDPIL